MKNTLVSFSFAQVSSTIRVIVDTDGTPWFVANDVADTIGYVNGRKAVQNHCKRAKYLKDIDVPKRYGQENQGLDPKTLMIDESDVYRFAFRSQIPNAEPFVDWVAEQVVPSIRKTGAYHAVQSAPALPELPIQNLLCNYGIIDATVLDLPHPDLIQVVSNQAAIIKAISDMEGSITITNAAEELKLPMRKCFQFLEGLGWIVKKSKTGPWQATTHARNKGWLIHKTWEVPDPDKPVWSRQARVTPKGMLALRELLLLLQTAKDEQG